MCSQAEGKGCWESGEARQETALGGPAEPVWSGPQRGCQPPGHLPHHPQGILQTTAHLRLLLLCFATPPEGAPATVRASSSIRGPDSISPSQRRLPLQRACRRHGIQRWPRRQLLKLSRAIDQINATGSLKNSDGTTANGAGTGFRPLCSPAPTRCRIEPRFSPIPITAWHLNPLSAANYLENYSPHLTGESDSEQAHPIE